MLCKERDWCRVDMAREIWKILTLASRIWWREWGHLTLINIPFKSWISLGNKRLKKNSKDGLRSAWIECFFGLSMDVCTKGCDFEYIILDMYVTIDNLMMKSNFFEDWHYFNHFCTKFLSIAPIRYWLSQI